MIIDENLYLSVWKAILVIAQFLPGCMLMLRYERESRRFSGLLFVIVMLVMLLMGSNLVCYVQMHTAKLANRIIYNFPTLIAYFILFCALSGLFAAFVDAPICRTIYLLFSVTALILLLSVVHQVVTPIIPNRTLLTSICYYLVLATIANRIIIHLAKKLVLPLMEQELEWLKQRLFIIPLSLCIIFLVMLKQEVPITVRAMLYRLLLVLLITILYLLLLWLLMHISDDLMRYRQFMVRTQQMDDFYLNLTRHVQKERTYRHDIRHHFMILKQMNSDGLSNEIDNYLSSYLNSMIPEKHPIYTGNYYADALIYHYFHLAESEGIQTSAHFDIPTTIHIAPYDLCSIFGNCLENALEACQQMSNKQYRFICVQGEIIGKKIILIFSNSYNGHLRIQECILSSKQGEGHGYGMQSVEYAAKHYDGEVQIDYNDRVFRVSVVLNQSVVAIP